jgi:hypothetical protein
MTLFEVLLFGFICTAAWVLCYCVVPNIVHLWTKTTKFFSPKYVVVVIICKYVKNILLLSLIFQFCVFLC